MPSRPRSSRGTRTPSSRSPSIQVNDVVVQGTDIESLQRGPGHYEETDDPWDDTGRVGIARAPDHVRRTVLGPGQGATRGPRHARYGVRDVRLPSDAVEGHRADPERRPGSHQEAHACAHDLHAEVLRGTAAHRLREANPRTRGCARLRLRRPVGGSPAPRGGGPGCPGTPRGCGARCPPRPRGSPAARTGRRPR